MRNKLYRFTLQFWSLKKQQAPLQTTIMAPIQELSPSKSYGKAFKDLPRE